MTMSGPSAPEELMMVIACLCKSINHVAEAPAVAKGHRCHAQGTTNVKLEGCVLISTLPTKWTVKMRTVMMLVEMIETENEDILLENLMHLYSSLYI